MDGSIVVEALVQEVVFLDGDRVVVRIPRENQAVCIPCRVKAAEEKA